jgi:hypothetical protein
MRLRAGEVQRHLGRARERIGDRLLTWLTILLIFLTFGIIPLHASGLIVAEGYGLAIVLVMAGCILGSSAGLGAVGAILAGVSLAIAASCRYNHSREACAISKRLLGSFFPPRFSRGSLPSNSKTAVGKPLV